MGGTGACGDKSLGEARPLISETLSWVGLAHGAGRTLLIWGSWGVGGWLEHRGLQGLARDQGQRAETRGTHPIERIVETPLRMTHWA